MEQDACKERRERLMALIGEAVAIMPTAPVRNRNNDVDYLFRPASDFYYLTGFPEPEAVAVFIPGRSEGQYLLFCRENNAEREQWEGRRTGQEGAMAHYRADQAFPIDRIDEILPGLLENRPRIYYHLGRHPEFDGRVIGWMNEVRKKNRSGVRAPGGILDLDEPLHEMRLRKGPDEVALMRRAGILTAQAHVQAMRTCRPGLFEYELEAELLHVFRKGGSAYPAYPPIVAGGANACILHYTENAAPLRDGSLVLIDAGCEIDCYASDITRTFPVGRRFTPGQRALYDIVLAAHDAALQQIAPGREWPAAHDAAVRILTEGLRDLGLLKGATDELIHTGAYRRFYMHRTGHWLGMDVHDVGEYRVGDGPRILEAGMVTTVEPGLYVRAADDIPEAFHDVGIRIEDDVLVTDAGHEILSDAVPRSAADVEALRAEAF